MAIRGSSLRELLLRLALIEKNCQDDAERRDSRVSNENYFETRIKLILRKKFRES